MHTEVLTADQLGILERIKLLRSVSKFYLAEGTALGLRHGHRRSVDFDWFRADSFSGRHLVAALEAQFARFERLPRAVTLSAYGSKA